MTSRIDARERGLAGRGALPRTLSKLATGILLLACPASWTIGALEPAAVAPVEPSGAWASFDVARARAAYGVRLASEESSPIPAGSSVVAQAALQADTVRPELIAAASEIAATHRSGARDLVATMTVEQAARVVLATNRPVAALYDEYRARPLVSTSDVARLARSGEVRLFAVSPDALSTVDPDLERWIGANTERVDGPAASDGLELREYRPGG